MTGDSVSSNDLRRRVWLEQRLSAGTGAKGSRWYDWARREVGRLQLTPEECA